ncbi:MAG: PAS domain S-box protein [Chloroflexi bacterium]|nr:MAG: PAS domain S-box protein [Chloroflexota bacterium]
MARRRDGQEARRRDTRPMKEGGLEAERLSLSDLLDTLPVPVIVYGADGRVLFANQARKDFAGDDVATLDGAIARTAPATEDGQIVPRERLPALRALRGESVRGERLRLRAADGHTEVLLVNASPLRDADGKIAAAVVVFHDITDLSDLERGRRELFAMANHDLRTPITVILAFVQLARRVARKDPDRAVKALSDIERQAQRMSRLVGDLLDVARFESGAIPVRPTENDLVETLRLAIERQSELSRFAISAPDAPVTLTFDVDRVDQILDNLLSNAIKHTASDTTVDVALTLERDEIVVRVTDHGGGIDADERALLFQPFYQTPRGRSYGGTGLGLHISRRIAEAHGGRLWLEDTVPGKTTFALALPRR